MRKIVQVTEEELISLITIAMIKFMDRLRGYEQSIF